MQLIISIIFILFSCGTAWADTHVADSCSKADISTAITAADTDDTVTVPSGTCDWSGETTLTISKKINMIGATAGCPSSCDDATKIQVGSIQPLAVTISGVRISGITFEGAGSSGGVVVVNAGGANSATNWRIDHCHFKDTTTRAISVGASASEANYGADFPALIDANRFSATARFKAVQIYGGSKDTVGSWADTLNLGSPNGTSFLFFENNILVYSTVTEGNSSIDSDTGGRMVIRYNTFTNGDISAHGLEYNFTLLWKSTHGWEIYNNYFNSDTHHDFQLNMRGGTGVIWGNSFNGTETAAKPVRYLYERGDMYDTVNSPPRGCNNDPSPCQGSGDYDGNQADKYGYICYQQIGATGTNGITSMPVYQWSNTYNGVQDEAASSQIEFAAECNYQHVAFGRDVILNGTTPKAGYSMYTCPHPLTGLTGKTCNTTAGTAGYGVDAEVTGSISGVTASGVTIQ